MKYDDASWHYDGDFPSDLPNEAGATHIAMFVSWAMLNGLAGELHAVEFPEELASLQSRIVKPTEWFLAACDEKFTDEDLSTEGNDFAREYYGDGTGLHAGPGSYLGDYGAAFPDMKTLYHVSDSWTSYDKLAPTLSMRLAEWQAKSPQPAS